MATVSSFLATTSFLEPVLQPSYSRLERRHSSKALHFVKCSAVPPSICWFGGCCVWLAPVSSWERPVGVYTDMLPSGALLILFTASVCSSPYFLLLWPCWCSLTKLSKYFTWFTNVFFLEWSVMQDLLLGKNMIIKVLVQTWFILKLIKNLHARSLTFSQLHPTNIWSRVSSLMTGTFIPSLRSSRKARPRGKN